jgi:hypothetical protein
MTTHLSDQDEDSAAKVKLKLMSIWNNVKYGKTMFTVVQSSSGSFSGQSPVWLLGSFYHRKSSSDQVITWVCSEITSKKFGVRFCKKVYNPSTSFE